ncbi:hypothetical protein [Robiginitalea sp. SC105]|uniref:hypothetical protein n=1 Tax=Robiginitalea sp. SC105 TaxID=2762332 RepID=UPI00163968BA|nr:hypothetical protein [Robiginitalea sp. SC105]MBC2837715.1 hypothetical protein [Robiginitalea sp. SC105]
MKKLMIAGLLLIGIGLSAQKGPAHHRGLAPGSSLTDEQIATLQSKRLTLALDLSEGQQSQVQALLEEQVATRREQFRTREGSPDSTLARGNRMDYSRLDERLDVQIAFQRRMQQILSEEQYLLWKKLRRERKPQRGGRRMHGKR